MVMPANPALIVKKPDLADSVSRAPASTDALPTTSHASFKMRETPPNAETLARAALTVRTLDHADFASQEPANTDVPPTISPAWLLSPISRTTNPNAVMLANQALTARKPETADFAFQELANTDASPTPTQLSASSDQPRSLSDLTDFNLT